MFSHVLLQSWNEASGPYMFSHVLLHSWNEASGPYMFSHVLLQSCSPRLDCPKSLFLRSFSHLGQVS
jgi:hypothetical protein